MPDGLKRLWNELVKDGEIPLKPSHVKINCDGVPAQKGETGKFYCGRHILKCSCCDGHCGPDGCNCDPCQKLDQEDREQKEEDERSPPAAGPLIDSWTWGDQPSTEQLRQVLQGLIFEQRELASQAAGTTLSAMRLQQRLAVLGRYFVALAREREAIKVNGINVKGVKKEKQGTVKKRKKRGSAETEQASLGLARIGARAALSFAFAFLRRAWRSGEDADLCRELLDEALEALQYLPEATLFDEAAVSPVWLEVVERATKFLRSVVAG